MVNIMLRGGNVAALSSAGRDGIRGARPLPGPSANLGPARACGKRETDTEATASVLAEKLAGVAAHLVVMKAKPLYMSAAYTVIAMNTSRTHHPSWSLALIFGSPSCLSSHETPMSTITTAGRGNAGPLGRVR